MLGTTQDPMPARQTITELQFVARMKEIILLFRQFIQLLGFLGPTQEPLSLFQNSNQF